MRFNGGSHSRGEELREPSWVTVNSGGREFMFWVFSELDGEPALVCFL